MATTNNSVNHKVTQYNIITGGSGNLLNNVAPSSTSGIPLISQGSSSQPICGTALVLGGGTGAVSFNTNGVVISNTSTTGALASLSLTSGQLIIGGTSTPSAATLTAGNGVSITNGNNSITLKATANFMAVTSITNLSSPYTVLTTDQFIAANSTSGTISVLLPNAPSTGQIWVIKDSAGTVLTNAISVTTVGGTVTIDGQTTYTFTSNYQSISVIFDGSNYEIF